MSAESSVEQQSERIEVDRERFEKLLSRIETLEDENDELRDRVGRLEAKANKTTHAAEQAQEAAESAEDAADTAVRMAKEARSRADDAVSTAEDAVETADDAATAAEDNASTIEKRKDIYTQMVSKVNTFEDRLEDFEGEFELSFDTETTKGAVKSMLVDLLLFRAYKKKHARRDNIEKASVECNAVHELAENDQIDISRPYGSQIASELADEKSWIHAKTGDERNTGKSKKIVVRLSDVPHALQRRAERLYEDKTSGGDED